MFSCFSYSDHNIVKFDKINSSPLFTLTSNLTMFWPNYGKKKNTLPFYFFASNQSLKSELKNFDLQNLTVLWKMGYCRRILHQKKNFEIDFQYLVVISGIKMKLFGGGPNLESEFSPRWLLIAIHCCISPGWYITSGWYTAIYSNK